MVTATLLPCLAGCSGGASETRPAPVIDGKTFPICAAGDVDCRTEQVRNERLGQLKLGMSEADLVELIGNPTQRKGPFFEAASGLMIEYWDWPAKGITVDMASAGENQPRHAYRVVARAPCDLETNRKIGIGSTEEEVLSAYASLEDPDFTVAGEKVVVGSVYEGVIFSFEQGKVTRIFIGASAE